MAQFKRLPKEKTTEPSVELSLKKGGKAQKMQLGGSPLLTPRTGIAPAMPMRRKNGGDIAKVEKELKAHEAKPASKGHKGLKTGGVANAQGGYKTGGVANAQGGYKKGGLASSGIIKSNTGKSTMSDGAKSPKIGGSTGVVKRGNAGGYKDGGFAEMQKSSAKHSNGHSCMKKGGMC
jgi:hypothetical protein